MRDSVYRVNTCSVPSSERNTSIIPSTFSPRQVGSFWDGEALSTFGWSWWRERGRSWRGRIAPALDDAESRVECKGLLFADDCFFYPIFLFQALVHSRLPSVRRKVILLPYVCLRYDADHLLRESALILPSIRIVFLNVPISQNLPLQW